MGQAVPDDDLPGSGNDANVVPDSDLPEGGTQSYGLSGITPGPISAPLVRGLLTPSQMLDPNNTAAINKLYGISSPPGTELENKIKNFVSSAPKGAGDYIQNLAIKHNAPPWLAATAGEATQLGTQAAEMAPFGVAGASASAASSMPYAAQEEAEISRIADIHESAAAKGFDIPEAGAPQRLAQAASNNQPLADNVVRGNFNLSPKAPLTPQMMESWRDGFNASNTYAEARAVPKVQLNDNAVESLASLPKPLYDRLGLDNKIAPDNTVAGSDAMDINQALRARASAFWKTSKMLPEYEDQAVAVTKAADSVEDSVSPYLKDPAQWALDRAKNAQSYNVQSALDAGHVDVGDLARMKFAKGQIKPWTGDISDLADLGNLHPDAFQLTRTPLPNYSALRKALAFGARATATYAAGKLGFGAVSHVIGQHAANSVAPE